MVLFFALNIFPTKSPNAYYKPTIIETLLRVCYKRGEPTLTKKYSFCAKHLKNVLVFLRYGEIMKLMHSLYNHSSNTMQERIFAILSPAQDFQTEDHQKIHEHWSPGHHKFFG